MKKKIKILNLEIKNCTMCPYCEWNVNIDDIPNLDEWSCEHPKILNKMITNKLPDEIKGKVEIPDWCPLENKED